MKYKVHGVSRTEVLVQVSHGDTPIVAKVEAVEVEFVPVESYGKSFTAVIVSKGPEDTAAIIASYADADGKPTEAEFQIEPVAV